MKLGRTSFFAFASMLACGPAHAAPTLEGAAMSWPWLLPFVGLLLSIATGPLLFSRIWHRHYPLIAAGWALLVLAAIAFRAGPSGAAAAFAHAAFGEYMSFIALLFALYVVAGGVRVTGRIHGTPLSNLTFLTIGTASASVIGTTGAAMILVRPLLNANATRQHVVHVVVFFIILVANIGGALSPLGDPPLFVGFLRGVDFFWPVQHLWRQTFITAAILLAIFYVLDLWLFRREPPRTQPTEPEPVRLRGSVNLLLIAAIIGSILLSAMWKPGVEFDILGTPVMLQNALRDVTLVVIALVSLWITPEEHRAANGFSWEPIREVAILFAAIFIAIVPVSAMLQAGRAGLFAPLLQVVTQADGQPHEVAYFWLAGMLSAFLDNAPTYLVFFDLAGGDARALMGPFAGTLAGISLGAVFMGALTYIGNAPNFMIYAIATERGIKMPSFFGYLLWSSLLLLPIFALLTLLPTAPSLPS